MSDEIQTIGTEDPEEYQPIEESGPAVKLSGYNLEIDVHEGKFNPNRVRFIVYGDSGAGKTVFASTWPKVLFLDIDKGMASVTKKVHRIDINTWSELEESVSYLGKENHPFKTVVVDSLNELQHLAMTHTVVKYPQIRRAYEDLPSQSDYGKMLDICDKIVRDLKALNMNIVFISNATSAEFETDILTLQLVGRNTAKNYTRMVDIVGYLYKIASGEGGANDRVMVFDAVNYTTKDRSSLLPANLKNPTYGKLYAFWSGKISKDRNKE